MGTNILSKRIGRISSRGCMSPTLQMTSAEPVILLCCICDVCCMEIPTVNLSRISSMCCERDSRGSRWFWIQLAGYSIYCFALKLCKMRTRFSVRQAVRHQLFAEYSQQKLPLLFSRSIATKLSCGKLDRDHVTHICMCVISQDVFAVVKRLIQNQT